MKSLYVSVEMDILSIVYYIITVWRENFSKPADTQYIFSCFVHLKGNVRVEYLMY